MYSLHKAGEYDTASIECWSKIMREKKGFVILTTLLILLLSIPIIWLLWKFVCKPVYRHFSGSKTAIEESVDKTENKGTTLSENFKKPIEYAKKLFTNEEEEKEADVKIDNCKSFLEKKDYENVLVACHGGIIRALCGYLEDQKNGIKWRPKPHNCEIRIYESVNGSHRRIK